MLTYKSVKLLSVLNDEQQDFINKNIEIKKYKKDDYLFSPLDKCTTVNFILDGKVKLCKVTKSGNEQIISVLERGGIFGEALVFDALNYPVYVIADKDCVIGMLRRNAIIELTKLNSEFTLNYFIELSKKIKILNEKVELLSYSSVKQRVAKYLLNMSIIQRSSKFELSHSKQRISEIIGTYREVVSRNFSSMERDGYFKVEDKTIILNIPKLEELV